MFLKNVYGIEGREEFQACHPLRCWFKRKWSNSWKLKSFPKVEGKFFLIVKRWPHNGLYQEVYNYKLRHFRPLHSLETMYKMSKRNEKKKEEEKREKMRQRSLTGRLKLFALSKQLVQSFKWKLVFSVMPDRCLFKVDEPLSLFPMGG